VVKILNGHVLIPDTVFYFLFIPLDIAG